MVKFDEYDKNRAYEIAAEMRKSGEWQPELCKELCELAGLGEEWEQADGENFEAVVDEAANRFGVDIY